MTIAPSHTDLFILLTLENICMTWDQ